jgi:hypothetical protein
MCSLLKPECSKSEDRAFQTAALRFSSEYRIKSGVICLGLITALVWGGTQAVLAQGTETAASATNPAATNSGPRIEFTDLTHDFGRVEAGKMVTNIYYFTNTGNQPLEIQDVQSSCGCAAAANYSRLVAPGQKGSIPVIFDSTGRAGQTLRTIKVLSNDSTEPNVVLQFTAMVWKPIDAIPVVAAFNFGPDFQTKQTRVIRLVNNLEEPVTLSEPVCTNRSFRPELKVIKEGREFELHIEVVPPLEAGSWSAPVELKTSTAKMPVVSVVAFAMVQAPITLMPPEIPIPPEPLEEAQDFTIAIRSNGTNTMNLTEPSVNVPGAKVQLRELQPGRSFSLIVSLPAGFGNTPGQAFEARVKSGNPQKPILIVPIRARRSLFDESAGTETGGSGLPAAVPRAASQK